MATIITVNGNSLESDKKGVSINNEKVWFNDGSWVNMKTGEGENKGSGFIKLNGKLIGTGEKSANTTTLEVIEKITSYEASALQVKSLIGNLTILPSKDAYIHVTLEGEKQKVESVIMEENGQNLTLNYELCATGGSNEKESNWVSQFIDCLKSKPTMITTDENLKTTVYIPNETTLDIETSLGDVTVCDLESDDVVFTIKGSRNFTAGKLKNLTARIKGSGNISVEEINGQKLHCVIIGSGDITVKKGTCKTLIMSIEGSGHNTFGGVAQDATLTIKGSGDITIENVKNKPESLIKGSGNITIHKKGWEN